VRRGGISGEISISMLNLKNINREKSVGKGSQKPSCTGSGIDNEQ